MFKVKGTILCPWGVLEDKSSRTSYLVLSYPVLIQPPISTNPYRWWPDATKFSRTSFKSAWAWLLICQMSFQWTVKPWQHKHTQPSELCLLYLLTVRYCYSHNSYVNTYNNPPHLSFTTNDCLLTTFVTYCTSSHQARVRGQHLWGQGQVLRGHGTEFCPRR